MLTRFGLRSPISLLPIYLDYRRTARRARVVPGFLAAAFLVAGPRTCFNLSIWADSSVIPLFGTMVAEHVEAARRSMGRVRMSPHGGPEIWSTRWRIDAASNNLNWGDFDLRHSIASELIRSVG